MLTIKESVRNKIEKARRWEEANPGRSWALEYREADPKIYLERHLVESAAYRSLSKSAMLAYQAFLTKRIMKPIKRHKEKFWVIENNGWIVFPYQEAQKAWGIPRQSFTNAIDELQAKGFIDITHQGTGGRKSAEGSGDYSTYRIDTRWEDFDEEKEVSKIPPTNPRRKDNRQRGFKLPAVRAKAYENKYKSNS